MRTPTQRVLNAVQRPDVYDELVITSDGAPVVLSVWRAEPGSPAVVFLPGTMTHPLLYEEFCDGLAGAGFTVVGLHGQGHGKSPRVRRPLTFGTLVTNARDAIAWALREVSEQVVVCGSSQGGVLAMTVAATEPRLTAVVAHNILDPELRDSLLVTRFPPRLRPAFPALRASIRLAGRVAPRLPVPFGAYLTMDRVTRDPSFADYFWTDPLGLRSYPLGFLGSLVGADLSGLRDGSIRCPVLVVAGRGDPLFPLDYTRQVFDEIVAPAKELLVVDVDVHLLLVEALEQTLPPLVQRLRTLTSPVSRPPSPAPAA